MSTKENAGRIELLLARGWIAAQEGTSENNRRAKLYRAIASVLKPAKEGLV